MEHARQWSDHVAVAARKESQIGQCDADWLPDDAGVEGPLGGLLAGLRFGRTIGVEAVLSIPADMPFLPEDLLDRLRGEIGDADAAIASSGGRLHPVCGLWRPASLDAAPDYLASGRRSLKGFAEAIGFEAVQWPADHLDPFFNINTAEDFVAAERLLGG